MYYLYGSKSGKAPQLVATFNSEQQLLAYVRWATVSATGGMHKFEQGSSLAGFQGWSYEKQPRPGDPVETVDHNPSPNMM